jgi:hypothetical protein
MRKALLLLALGLAACNLQGLPGSGEEGPGRAGRALGPRVLSYKGGLRWTSL